MSPSRNAALRRRLLAWFDRERRPMPWRETPTPYRVWISEIMLQQTQVATVIPYFERFVARLPDLESLATVDEEALLSLWSGLGYYRRARNLQAAARQVLAEHGGALPADADVLATLPGVGRYTAGAVSSIAFGRPEPALDGNGIRFLTRLDALAGDPARQPLHCASRRRASTRPTSASASTAASSASPSRARHKALRERFTLPNQELPAPAASGLEADFAQNPAAPPRHGTAARRRLRGTRGSAARPPDRPRSAACP